MIWLAAAILYPLLAAVWLSLQNIKIIGTPGEFVGLENYARLLRSDDFWLALGRSVVWVVGNAVVQTLAAFAAALLLNQRFRGQGFARIWIILSWIVPAVVVVIIWRWLLSSSGVVNYMLLSLGLVQEPVGFFGTRDAALRLRDPHQLVALVPLHDRDPPGRPPEHPARALRGGRRGRGNCAAALLRRSRCPCCSPSSSCWAWWGRCCRSTCSTSSGCSPAAGPPALRPRCRCSSTRRHSPSIGSSQAAAISVVSGLILVVFATLFIRFMAPKQEEEA